VPRLLAGAQRHGRAELAVLAIELGVPPLSVLAIAWVVAVVAAAGWWAVGGAHVPLVLLLSGGVAALTAALLAWAKFGRTVLPLTALLAAPWYILTKVPIYVAFLLRPQRAWVRTQRDAPVRPASPPAAEVAP
jgi:hypothetical protein